MKKITVTVGTVTYAIKLRRLLLRAGIRSKLVKVNSNKTEGGCTHGVELDEINFYYAVVIMRNNGINYSLYSPNSYDLS